MRLENRQSPRVYFRGLNLLLNEQEDEAIDAFVQAVQDDPDTSELHFALGNLFRRRGEFQRAVRVHQHLIARSDLKPTEHDRARFALAQDYLKAGLLNFAEETLRSLANTPYRHDAGLALLLIYERARDWGQADLVAQSLEQDGPTDQTALAQPPATHGNRSDGSTSFAIRRVHYLSEQALLAQQAGHTDMALALLERAQALAPNHPRPLIERAALLEKCGCAETAAQTLLQLTQPQYYARVALDLARLYPLCSGPVAQQVQSILRENYTRYHALDVLLALVQIDPGVDAGARWYRLHLQHEISLIAAAGYLRQQKVDPDLQRALDASTAPLLRYRCAACGFETRTHFWQCPGCLNWDSTPVRRVEEL